MFREDHLKTIGEEEKRWAEDLSKVFSEVPERLSRFSTVSDMEIKGLYTPKDIEHLDYSRT